MLDDMLRALDAAQVIVRSRWSGGEGMLRRGRDGRSEGDEGARGGGSGRAATPQAANQSTSHLASMRSSSFPAADWRLCLRPIFGISARFSLLFGFPFWKTHLGAFLSSVKNPD